MTLVLHTYFRSSASFRVRIALALKGLEYTSRPVSLVRNGGEQLTPDYAALNPAQLVPVLEHDGVVLTQSLAIIDYLDEIAPEPSLIGRTPAERARVRSMALDIACEIHPIDNLRVLRYLTGPMGVGEDDKNRWYRHWVESGLGALEQRIDAATPFCAGDRPTLADCCLVPQVYNARRFECKVDRIPKLMAIHARCMALPAFQQAEPAAQPDAG